MTLVCDKDKCTGCKMCLEVCPMAAINVEDSLRSYNAVIDPKKCVDCNACHKWCQVNAEIDLLEPIAWFQGWSRNDDIRMHSSSGGIAAALMKAFVQNGTVCSCTFRNGKFGFEFAESVDDIDKFVGSKYVKSDPDGIYRKLLAKLKNGERILFIGLPCQVAAVRKFVGIKYDEKLYTVDLICHGSPSPKFLEMFLKEHGYNLNKINNIQFRNKTNFHVYRSSIGISPDGVTDMYTHAFLSCLDYTENCYFCKYAKEKRASDLTIGDSWGSSLPLEELHRGISLMIAQSDKGMELLKNSNIELIAVDKEKAIMANVQLRHPSHAPKEREKFFKYIDKGNGFENAMAHCYPKVYYKQKIKALLIKHKIIGGGTSRD